MKNVPPTKSAKKSYFEKSTRVPPKFPLQQMRKSKRKAVEFINAMCMENTRNSNNITGNTNTCSNNNDNNTPPVYTRLKPV